MTPATPKRVLLVEDMRALANMVAAMILDKWGLQSDIATTLEKTRELLNQNTHDYFVAVVDLHLPDAPDGEAIDEVIQSKIPVLAFTGQYSESLREDVLSKGVVDYTLKQGQGVEHVVNMVGRLHKNAAVKVLVVDDSRVARNSIVNTLKQQRFQTFIAESGERALNILAEQPDIKIALVDTYMEPMDGFQLTAKIREKFPRDQLGIIGMSSQGGQALSAKFIKHGANDFLNKPFLPEEFFCRVNQTAEYLEQVSELKAMNQQKNKLLGMAAHDIRGPLGAIQTASQMMGRAELKPERRELMLKMIQENAAHMLSIVNSLLDVSTIEHGDFSLNKRFSNLAQLLEERVQFWQTRAEEKNIQIETSILPLTDIEFDLERIHQVIDNLISNALKYSPAGTCVSISVKADMDGQSLHVIDQGPGIAVDKRHQLFGAFARLGNQTTGGESSTGLGLAICKAIIEKHGGKIEFHPATPNGSHFMFRLPGSRTG